MTNFLASAAQAHPESIDPLHALIASVILWGTFITWVLVDYKKGKR